MTVAIRLGDGPVGSRLLNVAIHAAPGGQLQE